MEGFSFYKDIAQSQIGLVFPELMCWQHKPLYGSMKAGLLCTSGLLPQMGSDVACTGTTPKE